MEHEMILVPRAELLAWAKAWLHDYDPNDGTDCVTPFDGYLLCTPKLESAPVGVNRLVGLMREVIPALRATGVNVTLADDVEKAAALAQQTAAEAQAQGGGDMTECGHSKYDPCHNCEPLDAPPSVPVGVDELAQVIREVDGNHSLGAGALAEAILEKFPAITQKPSVAPVGVPPPSSVAWYPIETAPKDNKHPLYLAQFDLDTGELIELDWDAAWEAESESWEIPEVYYIWRSANGRVEEPTHWAYQNAAAQQPVGVEGYLVERLHGDGYGPARRIVDAAMADPTDDLFWSGPEAQARHRVTPLVPALAQQPAAVDGALSVGQRVEWQDNVGRWWPCRITGRSPATYTALLDDGTDAEEYARGRFRALSAQQGGSDNDR